MDKHLNDLIVGVPNHIESYSNQKVFVREKEDNKMAKRRTVKKQNLSVTVAVRLY